MKREQQDEERNKSSSFYFFPVTNKITREGRKGNEKDSPHSTRLVKKQRRLIDQHETVLTRTGCGLILNNCCWQAGNGTRCERETEKKKEVERS